MAAVFRVLMAVIDKNINFHRIKLVSRPIVESGADSHRFLFLSFQIFNFSVTYNKMNTSINLGASQSLYMYASRYIILGFHSPNIHFGGERDVYHYHFDFLFLFSVQSRQRNENIIRYYEQ